MKFNKYYLKEMNKAKFAKEISAAGKQKNKNRLNNLKATIQDMFLPKDDKASLISMINNHLRKL